MKDDLPPYATKAFAEIREQEAKKKPKARKKGKVEATESVIGEVLRTDYDLFEGNLFRLDTFSGRTLLMRPVPVRGIDPVRPWVPIDTTDVHVTHLMMWMQDNGFVKVSASRVQRAIDVEAERNAFSSAMEALDALPDWDQQSRLGRFWIDVCGAETHEDGMSDNEVFNRTRYLHHTARCFFISIIARILDPGCKVDTMPILEGPQGVQKSTLLRALAFNRDDWFSDSLPRNLADKDARQHLPGKLIIEFSEMSQISPNRVEVMKSFISAQDDKYRPSYGRREKTLKRQCVFVGTSNSDDYLVDFTGNRRFWPIACGKIDVEMARDLMPQLYAEALAAYHCDEAWWLPAEINEIAEGEQNHRLMDDLWNGAVKVAMDQQKNEAIGRGESTFWVTPVQAMTQISSEMRDWNDEARKKVRRILKKLGGDYRMLPRSNGWPDRGFRFVIGANGGGSDPKSATKSVKVLRTATDKSLN